MRGALPRTAGSFVGRGRELADIQRLFTGTTVLTLSGPVGAGKSRLAVEFAGNSGHIWADGVVFVDLAPVRDPALFARTVALAVGLTDRAGDPDPAVDADRRLTEFLADQDLLLVLDNCEDLASACANLVSRISSVTTRVRVLVTSRHVLGISDETVYQVAGLPIEPDAVDLFVARASAARPAFPVDTLDEHERRQVAALCRALDGIPLAIELAAVDMLGLSVEEFQTRLDASFVSLCVGTDVAPARSRAIGAVHNASYRRHEPAEQLLWTRLSVFRGNFTLDAAETICSDSDLPRADVLDVLVALVDKSVVLRSDDGDVSHYRLLATVRGYGHWRLTQTGTHQDLARKHRDYYAELVRAAETEWFASRQQHRILRMLRAEHANLAAALEFCLATSGEQLAGLELVSRLSYYWICCGVLDEGLWWSHRALRLCSEPTGSRVMALWAHAVLLAVRGSLADAHTAATECLTQAHRNGDGTQLAFAGFAEGCVLLVADDQVAALARMRAAISHFEEVGGYRTTVMAARNAIAFILAVRGETGQAAETARDVLRECDAGGEQWARSYAHCALALAQRHAGELMSAVDHVRAGIMQAAAFDDLLCLGLLVELWAWIAADDRSPRLAARLFGLASRIWPLVGGSAIAGSRSWLRPHRACLARSRRALGRDTFAAEFAIGARQGQDVPTAIAAMLGEPLTEIPASGSETEPRPATNAGSAGDVVLTRREHQVAELVGAGLTNRDIASRLLIAPHTAEAHVNHILTKLALTGRSQIAAWVATRRKR